MYLYYIFFFRSVTGTSVKDHLVYLGVNLKAETWGTCRIVMDYSVLPYQMDLAGNVVLSKYAIPKESESKYIVQPSKQGKGVSSTSVIQVVMWEYTGGVHLIAMDSRKVGLILSKNENVVYSSFFLLLNLQFLCVKKYYDGTRQEILVRNAFPFL